MVMVSCALSISEAGLDTPTTPVNVAQLIRTGL